MENYAQTLVPIVVEQTPKGERAYDIYSRLLNPTSISLANHIVDIECGEESNEYLAWNFNSGMAAIDGVMSCKAFDNRAGVGLMCETLQALGDRVNEEADTDYLAVSFETSDRRGVEPGFLFNRQMVQLIDAFQMTGAEVEAAFGPSSPSPGREPIVGTFDVCGEVITIIGNHFKSKGRDEPVFATNWPPVRSTELQRKDQARAVRTYVNALFAEDPDSLVMVAGDLNDFQFGEPGEGVDHPVAILEGFGDEIPLVNIINFVHPLDRFTYVYEGNSQVLDHMLVSPALLGYHAGENILHFNASYPHTMVDDRTTAHRSSDHDPVEMWLRLK